MRPPQLVRQHGRGDEASRRAEAFEHFALAVTATSDLNELLRKLLEVFVEVSHADAAIARLREGELMQTRVSVNLEEEVTAGFARPLASVVNGPEEKERLLTRLALDGTDAGVSDQAREKGFAMGQCLRLPNGEQLVGTVNLYFARERSISEDEAALLKTLAQSAAQAVIRSRSHEALETALQSRDEILGVVAHDLKNPLNVIALAANSLNQRMTESQNRRPVERIMRAAQRAERLIRDLLEVNAIEGGRFSVEMRRVDTANTMLSAVESQQNLAASASVIVATDLAPELPQVLADEERMLEVLENLVGNAVKFTNAGGTVTIGAGPQDKEILCWVKDTGQGIPNEQLPHLFDRFWQARKRDRRGTGLGLTICKAIVEAHGGRIWAESQPGKGTTMFFTLPIADANPQRRTTDDVLNILIVDDRPENLLSLKAILERPDYRLVTATSGEEALSLALRGTYAVAMIDIAMPGMDGLEVAMHLKELERSRDVPIIFITAFGDDPQEIHRAYAAGGADYLVKPLDAEIVRKKVAVFVDLSRRRLAALPKS
jgi:signal transduction histidine kinase/ActR/RegA family two-component response regulator